MKPIIAFSSSYDPTVHPHGYEVWGPHFYIYSAYIRPIIHHGGAPVIIPVFRDQDFYKESLQHAQGLVLIGGVDVNPFLFGQNVETGMDKNDPDKDFGEIEMTKIALEMNIPILAICRGIQLLNLVLGGTLHQHIPDDIPDAFKHSTHFPPGTLAHWVNVSQDSNLFRIVNKTRIASNSNHHQAVDKVGQGAIVVGRTDDGVIEAIEMPHKKWVLGVQWHPELIWENNEEHSNIFHAFVTACGS